jgi:hypothetical protein
MRSSILALVATALLVSIAAGAPDDRKGIGASAPPAGFSRRLVAETVPATLPKARETTTLMPGAPPAATPGALFAAVRVTAEVGADE